MLTDTEPKLGQLALSRDAGESITLKVPPSDQPQLIEMKLVWVRGNKARLAWKAERQVEIWRSELLEA